VTGPRGSAADELARSALAWLETMRAPDAENGAPQYRLHAQATPTPFAACFAVFLQHLLGALAGRPAAERQATIDWLKGLQHPSTGVFEDHAHARRAPDAAHDATHLNFQLTTFALSALGALGADAAPLAFLAEWPAARVERWLSGLDWREPWNCGNKAMFLGICLAYESQRARVPGAAAALDAWFAWHDRASDPATGFWGRGAQARYLDGMGGAYHQFLVYDWAGRPVPHFDRAVDRTLLVQSVDGGYSPYLGGATCYEADAVHILVQGHRRFPDRRAAIARALARIEPIVLAARNHDGGFGWGRWQRMSPATVCRVAIDGVRHRSPAYFAFTAKGAAVTWLKPELVLKTGWAAEPRAYSASSVFDTWFRLVTLAQIGLVLDRPWSRAGWQFLHTPGLGWMPAR
jgi:hypothetical protein